MSSKWLFCFSFLSNNDCGLSCPSSGGWLIVSRAIQNWDIETMIACYYFHWGMLVVEENNLITKYQEHPCTICNTIHSFIKFIHCDIACCSTTARIKGLHDIRIHWLLIIFTYMWRTIMTPILVLSVVAINSS